MKHICKKRHLNKKNDLTDIIFDQNCIFLDIETTGFSPASSQIYLIGCLRRIEENIIVDQFFAENIDDEKNVLILFLELVNQYKTIITFNGNGFDLPFIKTRCDLYGLEGNFSTFAFIDIFKIASKLKSLLQLPNYKQKTIERFLGFLRDDQFTGGELIAVYEEYVKTRDPLAEELLLLHNYEDVIGMLDLLPILSYSEVLHGAYTISKAEVVPYITYEGESAQELMITLQNTYPVPKRVSCQCNEFYLTMDQNISRIRIPVFEGELHYFYPNYKDYYYLPEEDMAIHKSIATFVDKEYRQKAKASNCYTRKAGTFLPQYEAIIEPLFLQDYKDKCSYFEYSENFRSSQELLRQYISHILSLFQK